MNFFGHATVASWEREDAPYVLGSMLPDFLGMSRSRPVTVEHEVVRAGVELHHATDSVFHHAPAFLRATGAALDRLVGEGVGRGPARAAAHVGVELLLDGLLVEDERARRAYLNAVGAQSLVEGLSFAEPAARERFVALFERIGHWGVPDELARAEGVLRRLERALRDRPRLALDTEAMGHVGRWLPDARAGLVEAREELMSQVKAGMRELAGG